MSILVTGGAGFIGSHTCVSLLNAGFDVVVVDNLENSHSQALKRVEAICGRDLAFEQGDVRDGSFMQRVLTKYRCESVIHFAGLKAVGQSAQQPLLYYDSNVITTLRLLQAMQAVGIKNIIFSSTATVYGTPIYLPYDENHPLSPENTYGRTKLVIEKMLHDLYVSDPDWKIVVLRYFNPVGAHASGLIGEDPKGIPNNLMPLIAQTAMGRQEKLIIWGNDYATRDGTGVRDYIHVDDLAQGHVKALQLLQSPGYEVLNLGRGDGYSVLEVIRAFEHVSNRCLPVEIGPRRAGDIGEFYANPQTAQQRLNWQATRDLQTMCADMWHFQLKNPQGYQ